MSAYWIAHVTVHDPAAYAGYQALAPKAFAKFGAEFLARGGAIRDAWKVPSSSAMS
ncbi:DUF1330 domain-containing protein [Paracoccus sp. DMF-8]|uniref:DUF1330 domain-containing protein n=1 Tax=Paracoccus sp. DMF-8 TaxID=3019445 RepID=UPI0032046487